MNKIVIALFMIFITINAEAVVWNLRGHIRITNTAARNVTLNYLASKTSNYALIEQGGYCLGNGFVFSTDTVLFSIRVDKQSIREEMKGFLLNKIDQYSTYIGTGSALYRHKCYNDSPSGECQPCIEELIWSK